MNIKLSRQNLHHHSLAKDITLLQPASFSFISAMRLVI
jgi:hypothetical protein